MDLTHITVIRGKELTSDLDGLSLRATDDIGGGNERIIVEHAGRRFALVSVADLAWLEEADAQVDRGLAADAARESGK